MPQRPLKIGVSIVGEQHPRFVIVNNRRQFWGGTDWTTNFRKALISPTPVSCRGMLRNCGKDIAPDSCQLGNHRPRSRSLGPFLRPPSVRSAALLCLNRWDVFGERTDP